MIEHYTNDELIDELMKRPTFKGMIVWGKGEYTNGQEGDGGLRVRITKGIKLLDLMTYLDMLIVKVKEMFPKAFEDYFGERWQSGD